METPKAICAKCKYYRNCGLHGLLHLCAHADNCKINPVTGDVDMKDCEDANRFGMCDLFEERISTRFWDRIKSIFGE